MINIYVSPCGNNYTYTISKIFDEGKYILSSPLIESYEKFIKSIRNNHHDIKNIKLCDVNVEGVKELENKIFSDITA